MKRALCLIVTFVTGTASAESDGGVTWERCQIIRVLPDSRLRVEMRGRESNYALEGIALGPPSVSFVQHVARVATKPSRTECSVGGASRSRELDAGTSGPTLRIRSALGDAGWVDLTGSPLQ